jgi:hypothetical protein
VALLWFALDTYSLAGISVAIATTQQGNESNEIILSFPALTGQSYTIEDSTDLVNWQVLDQGIAG